MNIPVKGVGTDTGCSFLHFASLERALITAHNHALVLERNKVSECARVANFGVPRAACYTLAVRACVFDTDTCLHVRT